MEFDPVKFAEHMKLVEAWADENGFLYIPSRGRVLCRTVEVDLTAGDPKFFAVAAIEQVFNHAFAAGAKDKAAEICGALFITELKP